MAHPKSKTLPKDLGKLLASARGDEIQQIDVRAAIPTQKHAKKTPSAKQAPATIKNSKKKLDRSKIIGKKNVSSIESGLEIPSLNKLTDWVATIEKLRHDKDSKKKHHSFTNRELALFLTYWMDEQIKQVKKKKRAVGDARKGRTNPPKSLLETYQHDFLERAESIVRKWRNANLANTFAAPSRLSPPILDPAGLQTILEDCIVIVGASVHQPPSTVLDLFRQNGRLSDLMNLPLLNFGSSPLLLTDRMVISLSEEQRREVLGSRHLLVIGGSSVNVVSRFLSNCCVFRLCYDERKYKFENFSDLEGGDPSGIFDSLLREPVFQIPHIVEVFYKLLNDPTAELNEMLNSHDLEEQLDADEQLRLLDLVSAVRRRMLDENASYNDIMQVLGSNRIFFSPLVPSLVETDRGDGSLSAITLGSNYWAKSDPTRVCLLVMGSNSYGTAGALRVLAKPHSYLSERPLGGLLRVIPAHSDSEYVRFVDSGIEWVTPPYTIEKVVEKDHLDKLSRELKKAGKPTNLAFHKNSAQFQEYKEFVQRFQLSDSKSRSRKSTK